MKKKNEPKIRVGVMVFMALISISVFVGSASANTIYVPDNYEKIQWAVDNATIGSTIIVRDGTYDENVNVNKRLMIQSENGSDSTIVQAAKSNDHVFAVTADYVNISGFTVKGAGFSGPYLPKYYAGIYLGNADFCNVSYNKASDNCYGICLDNSNDNILKNNDVNSNDYYGIKLSGSSNNDVTNNNVNSNEGDGICLYSSNNCKLESNIISNNYRGIILSSSSGNNIVKNTIKHNHYSGIRLSSSSNYNTLTSNTFIRDGLFVSGAYHNTVENNTVNDKPLVYFEDESDYIIVDINAGQIILVRCNNITIRDSFIINPYGTYKTYVGIEFLETENCKIMNNTVNSNCYGIYLSSSNNNTIGNNTAVSNLLAGIYLSSSGNNIIKENYASNIYNGIYLSNSGNNTIEDNIASNNCLGGISLHSSVKDGMTSSNNTIKNNIVSNNGDGIRLRPYVQTGCIHIRYPCDYNLIKNNTISNNNGDGIYLFFSNNNTISDNSVSSNENGVYLEASSDNAIKDNSISSNGEGICLHSHDSRYPSVYNLIKDNIVSNNNQGIYLSSSSNSRIYNNNFDNAKNAYSHGSTNIWNSTEKIDYTYNGNMFTNYLGNYWSDYNSVDANNDGIWDNPRSIDSDWDYHPLVEPFENYPAPTKNIFDTGSPANPYPSIMGNHTGTIKPNHTVIATKLYTYPCVGTGGHTEYAHIWNKTWNATATWEGYVGDWHNITFDKTVVLLAGETYDYTIRTGSYPQIIHTPALPTANGWINCTKFTDANGRIYTDWIPAIRLGV